MRHQRMLMGFLLALTAGMLSVWWAPAAEPPDNAKLTKLIQQLGSSQYDDREKASAALEALGTPALPALYKAAKGDDAEVRRRCEELIAKIEKKAETAQILSPKKIHLVFKDTPVDQAVAELKKASGYDITLHDPQNKLKDRTVTLDTGETTFWHALDVFCQKAGLVEATPNDLINVRPPVAVPVGAPLAPGPAPRKPQPGALAAAAEVKGAQPARPLPGFVPLGGPVAVRMGGQMQLSLGTPEHIILIAGKANAVPTDDSTALRIRALRNPGVAGQPLNGELLVALQITPEPRLRWQGMVSSRVDKAIDDKDQKLTEATSAAASLPPVAAPPTVRVFRPHMAGAVPISSSQALVRLKRGEKESRSLKELSGTLTVRMLMDPKPIISVDDVLKAAGKTTNGKDGGAIKVLEVKQAKDQITLRVEVDPPAGVLAEQTHFQNPRMPAVLPKGIVVAPAPAAVGPVPAAPVVGAAGVAAEVTGPFNGLTLVDDKDKPLAAQFQVRYTFVPGAPAKMETHIVFRPGKDKGMPARLVYTGRRSVTVDVPYTLKNIPLP